MSLLTLPTELRYQIWSYLTSHERIVYPFYPDITITSISHKPPPSTLQGSCRFLYYDINAYFYSIATVEISAILFATGHLDNVPAYAMIGQARSVEVNLIWRNDDEEVFQRSVQMELHIKAIHLLNDKAKFLKKLVVTVFDIARDIGLDEKMEMLAPLKEVKEGVTIVVGKVETVWGNNSQCKEMVEKRVRELTARRA